MSSPLGPQQSSEGRRYLWPRGAEAKGLGAVREHTAKEKNGGRVEKEKKENEKLGSTATLVANAVKELGSTTTLNNVVLAHSVTETKTD